MNTGCIHCVNEEGSPSLAGSILCYKDIWRLHSLGKTGSVTQRDWEEGRSFIGRVLLNVQV